MNLHAFLARQAEAHWLKGQEIPRSLFMQFQAAGLRVDRAHMAFQINQSQGI